MKSHWSDHPSIVIKDNEPHLRVFNYFAVDKTLPKFLDENGMVVVSKNKRMSIEEYLNSPDKRSAYRRSYNTYSASSDLEEVKRALSEEMSDAKENKGFFGLLKCLFSKKKEAADEEPKQKIEQKDDIIDTFDRTKSSLRKIGSDEDLSLAKKKIDEIYSKLIKSGQYEIALKMSNEKDIMAKEVVLSKNGFSLFLLEEDVIDLLKTADFGIRLDFLEDYPEILPDDIAELKIKADELKIFDNWCILHYDPDGSTLRQIEEIERRRDPILFGMIAGSGKIYKVADWVYKDDDVTVEKICSILNIKSLRSSGTNSLGINVDMLANEIYVISNDMETTNALVEDEVEPPRNDII